MLLLLIGPNPGSKILKALSRYLLIEKLMNEGFMNVFLKF